MSSVLLDFVPPSQKMSFFDCRPRKSNLQGVCCNTIDGNRESDWCHVGSLHGLLSLPPATATAATGRGSEVTNYLWNNLITGFVLAGFFSWPCARKKYPSRKFRQPQLWYFQSSGGLSHGKIFIDTGVATKEKCGVSWSGVCWRLAKG